MIDKFPLGTEVILCSDYIKNNLPKLFGLTGTIIDVQQNDSILHDAVTKYLYYIHHTGKNNKTNRIALFIDEFIPLNEYKNLSKEDVL